MFPTSCFLHTRLAFATRHSPRSLTHSIIEAPDMNSPHEFIRVVQSLFRWESLITRSLYNYDKIFYAFERANRCSAILSILPPSPGLTQLHATIIDMLSILKSCKADAEVLIRHLCFSFSGNDLSRFNPYECDIKEVGGGKRVTRRRLSAFNSSSTSSWISSSPGTPSTTPTTTTTRHNYPRFWTPLRPSPRSTRPSTSTRSAPTPGTAPR